MPGFVDFSQPTLWLSAGAIVFNPTFWNIVARQEYHNKVITKLFGGNARRGCYALAMTIFSLGLIRDYIYHTALMAQPTSKILSSSPTTTILAYTLLAAGNTLVITSTYALGITGTFLGDYFGILMDDMVTGFPFNVTDSPMYVGSTCSFVGTALLYGKPAGLLLSMLVWYVYKVALSFEDPFTREIYRKREEQKTGGKKSQ